MIDAMPKPEKHVFVCTQNRAAGHPRGSCTQKGCHEVMAGFLDELQKRQCFNQFAVTNTGCIGPCMQGVTVLIYPEGVMYGNVKKEDIAEIFDEHLLNGKIIERLLMPKEVWG